MHKIKQLGLSLAVVLGLIVGLLAPVTVMAADAKTDTKAKASTTKKATDASGSEAVTQGYGTDTPLQNGMLVRLKEKDVKKVSVLKNGEGEKLHGVVVASNEAAVSLSNDGNTGQVFVATFGRYEVLVSNQNGPIKAGDYITISALAGVGMKTDDVQPTVVGKAAEDFTGNGKVASTAKLKDSTGKEVNVSIGRIIVEVSVAHNPLQKPRADGLPSFLSSASRAVSGGKQVGAARVYLSLILLMFSSFVSGAILYSGIRGGLISMGRNPLAKKQIIAGIFRVVLSGLICFILGVFGVYLLLKL